MRSFFTTLRRFITRPTVRFAIWIACLMGIPLSFAILRTARLLFETTGVFLWKVVLQRGRFPVLTADGILLCLCAVSIVCAWRECRSKLRPYGRSIFLTLFALGVTVLLWRVILTTRVGLDKENAFFGKPTVPLMEWHLIAAFLLCLIRVLIGGRFVVARRWTPLLIWAVAVLIWTAIPNQHGFFSPSGRAPNFETYPFSDGSFYGHYARAAAAGMGFKGTDIPPRPFYIAVLTFLHLIADNRYETIIFLQSLILAWLPALVYAIGRDLRSEGGGLAAALLVILRETNAILSAPFGHNVSTTKYFFSDLPTALAAAFLLWSVLRWLRLSQREGQSARAYALFSGCALALMTLIRTQSLCLIIPIAIAFLIRSRSPRQGAMFLLGLGFCVAPWLIRNASVTGKFVFDHPMTQTAEMARSYNFDGANLDRLDGENDGDYSDRLAGFIAESIANHPAEISRFIPAHFVNGCIANLRLIPIRQSLTAPAELLRGHSPFWEELDSADADPYNQIVLLAGVLILLLGIGRACRKTNKTEGLLPLCSVILFNFSTAVGRYSAGRYLIPLDWIVMLYLGMGFNTLISGIRTFSGLNTSRTMEAPAEIRPLRLWVPLVTAILIAGAIPLAEHAIPQTFIPESAETVRTALGSPTLPCDESDRLFLNALAIYPRYYAAGEGEPESAKQGYGVSDYGRLVFLTLAPNGFGTFEMPTDTPPNFFPDGAEIRVAACQAGATSIVERLQVITAEES